MHIRFSKQQWKRIGNQAGWLSKNSEMAKEHTRSNPVFDHADNKVLDNEDHFPLGDADQARNALARANKYDSSPDWFNGSLQELKDAVARQVKKDFPSIDVTEEATD